MAKLVLTVKPVSKNTTHFLKKSLTLIFNSNQCYYSSVSTVLLRSVQNDG